MSDLRQPARVLLEAVDMEEIVHVEMMGQFRYRRCVCKSGDARVERPSF